MISILTLLFSFHLQAASNELVVAMELSYPPFEMTDAKGKPSGVSVEMAKELSKYLKKTLRIENTAYDGLIPALKTGKVDCIISSMTATEERSLSVDFSDHYLSTGLSLLIAKKSKVESESDLNQAGRIVVVKKGTTGHQYATRNLGKAKILVLDKEASAVLEVAQGKADAFIYDQLSVYQNWKKNADTTRPNLKPFRQEYWAIAVRKGNKELLGQINAFLKDFRAKKGFEKLGDQFLSEQKAAFKTLGISFYF